MEEIPLNISQRNTMKDLLSSKENIQTILAKIHVFVESSWSSKNHSSRTFLAVFNDDCINIT